MGAGCPLLRMAPGACDASRGDRPGPAPVWPRAAIPQRPRPPPGPVSWRGGRRRPPARRAPRPLGRAACAAAPPARVGRAGGTVRHRRTTWWAHRAATATAAGRVVSAAPAAGVGSVLPPDERPVRDAPGEAGPRTATRPPGRHAGAARDGRRGAGQGRRCPRDQERVLPHGTRRAHTWGEARVSTAAGAPAEPPGSRHHALEGPRWSRGKRSRGADVVLFAAWRGPGDVGVRCRVLT